MNTPNKLTVLRIILAPVFLLLLLLEFPHHLAAALVVFIAASVTDLIDGKIARKYNLITDFGKFLDPLADKMLTTAAYLGFIELGFGVGVVWVTMAILLREFLITSLRLIAAGGGRVIAANIWGKAKTVTQMTAIITVIFFEYLLSLGFLPVSFENPMRVIYTVILWVSAAATLLSGLEYMVENREFLRFSK